MQVCSQFNLTFALQEVPENHFIKIHPKTQDITGQALFLPAKYVLLKRIDR